MILEGNNSMQQPSLQNILQPKMVTNYISKPLWNPTNGQRQEDVNYNIRHTNTLPICLNKYQKRVWFQRNEMMPSKGLARQNVSCMFWNLDQKPTCSQGQCAYTNCL
jgi:hypothetical protein